MAESQGALAEWRRFWFLPLAGALGYATSVIHVYSFGPFIEPLQLEFGWSRAQASSGITVAAFLSAIFCIPLGMVVDRIGPRRVGLIGALLMATAYALLGTATGQTANWIILWIVVAIGTLSVQATVWTSAVASRFAESRGLALAVTLSGASVAQAVFPIMATWLIGAFDWRVAFAGVSGIWVALVFPVLFLCFRGAQDRHGKPQSEATPEPAGTLTGVSLAEGFRSAVLYKLLLAGGLFAFTVIGVVVHFVPILTDSGAEPIAAAGTASLVGLFSIIGRLSTGLLLDRLPAHLVGAAACLLPIVACTLLLLSNSNPISHAMAAAALGLTLGSEVDVIAYLAAKHFGLRNFGALYGAMGMALSLGTAFGPLAAGALFDQFGSYAEFLRMTAVLMAISGISLASLGSPARMNPSRAQR
jgi:MFS family permease